MHNRTVKLPDSFWKQIQAEAAKRELTISDLIMEAFMSRTFKINQE
jgi:predicted DNA-binding ribbon-helix-helix protein